MAKGTQSTRTIEGRGSLAGDGVYNLPQTDAISQRTKPIPSVGKGQADNFDNFKWPIEVTKTGTPHQFADKLGITPLEMKPGTCGEGSHKLASYDMKPCEVDKERRSFPGWCGYEPDTALMDAVSEEGTTETRGGYKTNVSHKEVGGKMRRRFGNPKMGGAGMVEVGSQPTTPSKMAREV